MVYYTIKLPPEYHQMTLEELLFSSESLDLTKFNNNNRNVTTTRTYSMYDLSWNIKRRVRVWELINELKTFNKNTEPLKSVPRKSLYREFSIPKKSGGFRKIDAPNDELKEALRGLKKIFEEKFGALYHTSAYAYISGRSTIDAVKKHQSNKSKWFGKYDLSNFFGSTTLEYTMKMLGMIFPFSEVIKADFWNGKQILEEALELAFLDGGLPQGTPISPLITNLIMIPVDYKLANTLRDWEGQAYTYTRYADDFLISSKYTFDVKKVEKLIVDTLAGFDAPFTINASKTRYGSSSGRNWNLGVMLNKDNEITVGHKKKKQFQAALHSFIVDTQNGNKWELGEVQELNGLYSYYRMVEKKTIDAIIEHVNKKHGVNVIEMIKEQLR